MATVCSEIVFTMVIVVALYASVNARSISLGENGFQLAPVRHTRSSSPTVHRFARNSICQTRNKQIRFFHVVATYLDKFSTGTVEAIVVDLCHRRDHMLDKWVSEIYDMDRDGHINHHERSRHNHLMEDFD